MDKIMASEQIDQAMPTAFRVAVRTLDAWGFSAGEMARVLGISPAQFQRYRHAGLPEESVNEDLTTRVSLVLGIERALEILLAEESDIRNWMSRPSDAPIFDGVTPRSIMINGELDDLWDVRRYLDGWLSGDFA